MGTLVPVPARVDTLGIAVPIDDFDRVGADHKISKEHTSAETHKWTRFLDGGGFVATGVGHAAWIEASLPKRADDERRNDQALLVSEAVEVLRDLYEDAGRYLAVCKGHAFEESKVVRLDLVRDFHGVSDPTPVLDGLASVDQPGRAKVRRFADPSANRAETLRVGPRAWGCTLYDKHTESGGSAPAGQLRYEARLHADQLRSTFAREHGGEVRHVADLTRSRVSRGDWSTDRGRSLAIAQRAWFDRVGFGLTVAGRNELVERLSAAGLRSSEAVGLWGYLTLPGAARSMHRNTRRKYRRLAVGLGLTPSFFGPDDVPSMTVPQPVELVRLDYDRGTLSKAA